MNMTKLALPLALAVLASCASQPKVTQETREAMEQQQQQQQLSAANARATQLEAQNAGLSDQLARQSAEVDALTQRVSDLQSANDELSSSLDSLRSGETKTDADYLARIAALTKDREELLVRVNEVEKEKATADIALLKSQQGLQDRIGELEELFAPEIEKGDMDIREYRDVLVVSVKESVFFVPDWPKMLPGAESILQRLATVFKKIPERIVRVEGNTAVAVSSPESLKDYPTSWHLGAARAATVVDYLQEKCDMDPLQLVATSFGQFRPIADNSTEQGKEKTRRVDFVLVSRDLWEMDMLKDVLQTPAP
jgi:flagellar motor protein MotB